MTVLLGSAREADAASFDQQVKVWRRDVDAALLDAVTIFGVDDFQGAGAAQDVGQDAWCPLRIYVCPLLVVA